ncbi:MAG: ribonuclease P protein component [Parcubacteria group bacterium]|nr:ribonuclease P protein component [Parcubacteria group bacterium]
MLQKKYRLSSPSLFQVVFNQGDFRENKFFSLVYRKNSLTYPRFGLVISSKIFRSAVERNAFKRKIHVFLQGYLPFFKSNFDIVIITKKGVVDKELTEIEEALKELLVSLS